MVFLFAALNLSHNKLTSLPDGFSNLKKLTTIDLSANEFTVIPEVVRMLSSLTTIDLSSNRIEDVCKEDYESLHCLEVLNLEDNPLRDDIKMLLQSIVRISIRT